MGNRSLDEFLGGHDDESGDDGEDPDDSDAGVDDASGDADPPAASDPSVDDPGHGPELEPDAAEATTDQCDTAAGRTDDANEVATTDGATAGEDEPPGAVDPSDSESELESDAEVDTAADPDPDPAPSPSTSREESAEARIDPATVEPMAPTAAWSADGASCPQCGNTVRRRWLDGGRRVCQDCKEW
jgi:hypothetical protein